VRVRERERKRESVRAHHPYIMEFQNYIQLNPILRYITLILFLACTAGADVVGNYHVPDQKLVFFDDTTTNALFLSCNVTEGSGQLIWKKNGTDVTSIEKLKGRFEIHEKENSFIIKNTKEDDDGLYTCELKDTNEKAEFNVVDAVHIKKIPENSGVTEGEKLVIVCKVTGTNPVITWKVGNSTQFNKTHVLFSPDSNNIENAILTIPHAEINDRNVYNCSATNLATQLSNGTYTSPEAGTFVRVRGKLVALWPFLGICGEVFILCAIILIYEKRRNKEGLDESDTDQSPEQEKLKTGK